MDQCRAVDGAPVDWHFVHYAERAKGGAGLVMTEMTCVRPRAASLQAARGSTRRSTSASGRIVDFVHAETPAKIGMQLGHSGPKGSTQLGWETMDAPLESGNWEVIGPSAVPWSPANQVPRVMTPSDMEAVREAFVAATRMADRAGFDWLELHCAHGYLLSAFITPLTNRRTDECGGGTENRMRFPMEVLRAIRAVWPDVKPISVRISAHDWVGAAGITPPDAVNVARFLFEGGADLIDVSAARRRSTRGPSTAACSRRRFPIASATKRGSRRWPSATSTN